MASLSCSISRRLQHARRVTEPTLRMQLRETRDRRRLLWLLIRTQHALQKCRVARA